MKPWLSIALDLSIGASCVLVAVGDRRGWNLWLCAFAPLIIVLLLAIARFLVELVRELKSNGKQDRLP